MNTIVRKIQKFDATGEAAGRLASRVATILIGKHKTDFMPNRDMGDFVVISNASKIKIHERKMILKSYHHHSHYAGGLKSETAKSVFDKDPSEILRRAVSRMLPKNSHRTARMKRLTIEN